MPISKIITESETEKDEARKLKQLSEDILQATEIEPLKNSIISFQKILKKVNKRQNNIIGFFTQKELCRDIINRDLQFQKRTPGLPYNAMIVPEELSFAAMMAHHLDLYGNNEKSFLDSLTRFVKRCDEFIPPIYEPATENEIKAVLSDAQKGFGMIKIIAPKNPFRIYRLNYSHKIRNSECGLSKEGPPQSFVLLFHPRYNTCDKVYIFAHEVGHALHFALTGDITVMPEGFEEFNDPRFGKFETLEERQEGFADAASIAILGWGKLISHLPTQYCKDISPMFVEYFKKLCKAK
jgi:hypothetical protein